MDSVKCIGVQLMTTYAIPFEFASLLLLIALIGAIMIAKHDTSSKVQPESLPNPDNKKNDNPRDLVASKK